MIKIDHLSFQYDNELKTIDNLNVTIEKNDKVTLIGKSGCGKTTLLFLLAGIKKPISGRVFIDGQELKGIRESTSVVFQNGGLYPWKTVYKNLEISLKKKDLSYSERKSKIETVLEELGIEHVINQYPKEISGGEKQRVAIGRVLVSQSDLLLLDEPSSSLDAMTKEKFQKSLLNLYKKHNLTSLVVTHDIEEAVFLGEKIVLMKNGRINEIIDNTDLYGKINAKRTLKFYERCIELRERLGYE